MAKRLAHSSLLYLLINVIGAFVLAPSLSHGEETAASPSPSPFPSASSPSAQLTYHGGPLLTGDIHVYIIWYGHIAKAHKTAVVEFFASFGASKQEPSVSSWWKVLGSYKDKVGKPVSGNIKLVKQVGDKYSMGNDLKRMVISNIVRSAIDSQKLPTDVNGVYIVVTAKDVNVEKFCMGSCGFHDSLQMSSDESVIFAHVGDVSVQCPGVCAWPFAIPASAPPGQKALVSPNGIAADGLIMNIATVLAGAATNPSKTGFYQGNALAPLEAASACPGVFGTGAYPGYPGELLVDQPSKASYNVHGANGKKFLLPAIWDLNRKTCKVSA